MDINGYKWIFSRPAKSGESRLGLRWIVVDPNLCSRTMMQTNSLHRQTMMQTAQALDSKCSCVTTSVRANGLRVLVRSSGMMRLSVDRTGEQGHKGRGFDQMPSTYQNHPRPKTFTNCVLKMRHYII